MGKVGSHLYISEGLTKETIRIEEGGQTFIYISEGLTEDNHF